MLVVNIIVSGAMNQEKVMGFKVFQVQKNAALVVFLQVILLRWKSHIAFGVNGIWIMMELG